MNNDGSLNNQDLTYLIAYLFSNGPAPDCGETGTVTDIDGNTYKTVVVGNQVWMAENLRVTHYRNGDPIPNVTEGWSSLNTGAYREWDDYVANASPYGRIYNWYAVNDSRNVAPEGWHIPTDEEWKLLEMHLGMSAAAADSAGWRGTEEGGKLKERGTLHWQSPNVGATDAVGFRALPFASTVSYATFWTATAETNHAYYRKIECDRADIERWVDLHNAGYLIRCVMD